MVEKRCFRLYTFFFPNQQLKQITSIIEKLQFLYEGPWTKMKKKTNDCLFLLYIFYGQKSVLLFVTREIIWNELFGKKNSTDFNMHGLKLMTSVSCFWKIIKGFLKKCWLKITQKKIVRSLSTYTPVSTNEVRMNGNRVLFQFKALFIKKIHWSTNLNFFLFFWWSLFFLLVYDISPVNM